MPNKYEIGEILTPDTANEYIGEMVLAFDNNHIPTFLRKLIGYMDGFWCVTCDNDGEAMKWDMAALPAKPKPKLWEGDPVIADGVWACYTDNRYFPTNYRIPTRQELEDAKRFTADQIEHLMARWQTVADPPKKATCTKCGGTGVIKYYHDAGDHFGSGSSPDSGWRSKPCDCGHKGG